MPLGCCGVQRRPSLVSLRLLVRAARQTLKPQPQRKVLRNNGSAHALEVCGVDTPNKSRSQGPTAPLGGALLPRSLTRFSQGDRPRSIVVRDPRASTDKQNHASRLPSHFRNQLCPPDDEIARSLNVPGRPWAAGISPQRPGLSTEVFPHQPEVILPLRWVFVAPQTSSARALTFEHTQLAPHAHLGAKPVCGVCVSTPASCHSAHAACRGGGLRAADPRGWVPRWANGPGRPPCRTTTSMRPSAAASTRYGRPTPVRSYHVLLQSLTGLCLW